MRRKSRLPHDVRMECIWIVRGYERRRAAYHAARREVINGTACTFTDKGSGERVYLPHADGDGRPAETKSEQLEAIEQWPETRRMKAVEQAKLHIGLDLTDNEWLRQQLTDGIISNCISNRKHPFAALNLPGISETSFKRRRTEFLTEIAEYLELLKK